MKLENLLSIKPLLVTSVLAMSVFGTSFQALAGHHKGSAYELQANQSQLTFFSIKSGSIGEVHEFKSLNGNVDKDGLVTVTIDLTSVETGIEIRNERMKSMLFNTNEFNTAKVQTEVSLDALKALKVGESFHRHVPVTLTLHGKSQKLTAHSDVVKLAANKVVIYSTKPAVVDASQFGLVEGIAALQKIAGLPSIATSVPVTFKLTFELPKSN